MKKLGVTRTLQFYPNNGKISLPQWKQSNCPVIAIYDYQVGNITNTKSQDYTFYCSILGWQRLGHPLWLYQSFDQVLSMFCSDLVANS